MTRLKIRCTPVVGQRLYKYVPVGSQFPARCLLSYGVEPQLHVDLAGAAVLELASAENGRRIRLSATGVPARMILHYPQLGSDTPPELLEPWDFELECSLEGTAIIWIPTSGLATIETGVLECGDLRTPSWHLLRDLWPVVPPRDWSWTYVWTPVGLALRGGLVFETKRDETLLLPQLLSPGRDLAWRPGSDSHLKFWGFDDLPKPDAANALAAAKARLSGNMPDDRAWPSPKWVTVARRWRVLSEPESGFVEAAFRQPHTDPNVELLHARPEGSTTVLDAGASSATLIGEHGVQAELWAANELHGQVQETAGLVFTLFGRLPGAILRWGVDQRQSTLRPAEAHATYSPGKNPGELVAVYLTLTTGGRIDDPKARIALTWDPAKTAPPQTGAIGETSMVFTALAQAAVATPASAQPTEPRWLHTQGAWIDLRGMGGQADPHTVAELLREASYQATSLRGGVPVGDLGGPQGLTAIVPGAGRAEQANSSVWLRLGVNQCVLELYRAILLWRTPAWWVTDTRASAPGRPSDAELPDLATAFNPRWTRAAATDDLAAGFQRTLATHYRATHWIGKMGVTYPAGWKLKLDNGETTLTLPDGVAANCLAYVEIADATLLGTRPYRGPSMSGFLLDGTRHLTRLQKPGGVVLKLGDRVLPRLAVPPFPSVESKPTGWQAAGDEMYLPHVHGLGYLPAQQAFQWRHGSLMLTDGWLRQRADGSLGDQLSDAPLESVRPEDDVALHDKTNGTSFTCTNGVANGSLTLHGWLPDRGIPVARARIRYRGNNNNPQSSLQMDLKTGPVDQDTLGLEVSTATNGFGGAEVALRSSDGKRYWLDKQGGNSFRNFGQPLLAAPDFAWTADGRGRRWSHFGDGVRQTTSSGQSADELTFTATAPVGLGAMSASVGLSLFGVAGLDPHAQWDLLGDPADDGEAGAAQAGPFPLLPLALSEADPGKITATVRIGRPFAPRSDAWAHSSGSVALRWSGSVRAGWNIDSAADGDFEWRMTEPCFLGDGTDRQAAAITPHRLRGKVSCLNGMLVLELAWVELDTPLGRVGFATRPSKLALVTNSDGALLSLPVESVNDALSGFRCTFLLHYRSAPEPTADRPSDKPSGWFIELAGNPAPTLAWDGAQGSLVLSFDRSRRPLLSGFSLHAGHTPVDLLLNIYRSSADTWGFVHRDNGDGHGHSAMVGRLSVEPGSTTPRLRWRFRASAPLQATNLFGRCVDADAVVRADLRVVCTGPLSASSMQHVNSVLTGRVLLPSDCRYDVTGTSEEVVAWGHECELVFDKLPLEKSGTLPREFFPVVLHTLRRADGAAATFQTVQRFSVDVTPALPVLASGCVLMLTQQSTGVAAFTPQVRLVGDPWISMAAKVRQAGLASGQIVRLPFRNEGSAVGLTVGKPIAAPALHGMPRLTLRISSPASDMDPDVWHERGALAGFLAPGVLAEYGRRQQPVDFGGKPFPQAGAALDELAPVLAVPGPYDAAFLANSAAPGVLAWPFLVAPADGTVAFPATTHAVQVELLALESADAQAPLPSVGSGLLQGAVTDEALGVWAGQEIRRQSLPGAAAAVVRGRLVLLREVQRTFHVAATHGEARPDPLPNAASLPPVSALADRDDVVTATGWQGRSRVEFTRTFRVEALSSRPLVNGPESGRLTRLAAPVLWETGLDDSAQRHGALALRQSVDFAGAERSRARWPIFRVHSAPVSSGTPPLPITPPLVDVTQWSVRPGEMLGSEYSIRDGTTFAGPAVAMALRSPRADNGTYGEALAFDASVPLRWDGVDWRLHSVKSTRLLGHPSHRIDGDLLLTAVTPRDTLVLDNAAETTGNLRIRYHARGSDQLTPRQRLTGYRLKEPLLIGLHEAMPGRFAYVELAVANGLAPGDAIPPDQVHMVEPVLDDPARWKENPDGFRCLVLKKWNSQTPLPNASALATNAAYDAEPGRRLGYLLEVTDLPADTAGTSVTIPWLIRNDKNAKLVVLIATGPDAPRTVAYALSIAWAEGAVAGQPERILVTSDHRIVGFGDFTGKLTIALDEARQQFVMDNACYAIEATSGQPRLRAWRFGPSGACTGSAG
jgi:hypothetical protein